MKKVVNYYSKITPIIDFSLGSKYDSLQYCQKNGHLKRYFPSYAKLRIIILIFLQKWEEHVTESNKRLRLWILLTGEPIQFTISADWIIEHDLCQILCVVLELLNFLWNREGWNSFWQPNVLSILGKITYLPKVSKNQQERSILICPKSAKWLSILNCSMPEKWAIWESIYHQSWRS